MFPCRLFVQGIWRSFAKNGHPRLLSQRKIGHCPEILPFCIRAQTDWETRSQHWMSWILPIALPPASCTAVSSDPWQPLIVCSRAGRAGLFIVPCFLHPTKQSHSVFVGQMPNSSLASYYILNKSFVDWNMSHDTLQCSFYPVNSTHMSWMLLQDVTHNPLLDTSPSHHVLLHSSPGVGRFDPHIIAHIFNIYIYRSILNVPEVIF